MVNPIAGIGNEMSVFKNQDLQVSGPKLNKYLSNFHPLEVMGRGSETQLQVGENLE